MTLERCLSEKIQRTPKDGEDDAKAKERGIGGKKRRRRVVAHSSETAGPRPPKNEKKETCTE